MFYKKFKNVGKKVLINKFNLDMTIKMIKKRFGELQKKIFCEAQARVRQGSARDGSQCERPQSLNPSLELTLNLVDPPTASLITLG